MAVVADTADGMHFEFTLTDEEVDLLEAVAAVRGCSLAEQVAEMMRAFVDSYRFVARTP